MGVYHIYETDEKYKADLTAKLISEYGAVVKGEAIEIQDCYGFNPNAYHGIASYSGPSWSEQHKDLVEYLENYHGDHSFILSLRDHYRRRKELSYKQTEALKVAILGKKRSPAMKTIDAGQTIILNNRGHIAVGVKSHAITVLEHHWETPKAYQLTVRLTAYAGIYCCVCGTRLTNSESRLAGIGPVCAEKMGIPRDEANPLRRLEETFKEIVLDKVWIPKFGVKDILPYEEVIEEVKQDASDKEHYETRD